MHHVFPRPEVGHHQHHAPMSLSPIPPPSSVPTDLRRSARQSSPTQPNISDYNHVSPCIVSTSTYHALLDALLNMILMTRLSARLHNLSTCSKPSQQIDSKKEFHATCTIFFVSICFFSFSVHPVHTRGPGNSFFNKQISVFFFVC